MRYLFACIVLLLFAVPGMATYEWRSFPAFDPNRIYLYQDGVQVGGYDIALRLYRPYDARTDTWGQACQSPFAVPSNTPAQENHGVDSSRISDTERITYQGREITRQEAFSLIGSQIPNDANHLRVTVIGSPQETHSVASDFATSPALAVFRDHILINEYPPDHWAITSCGFVATGHPTVYIQTPDGRVLHRQDTYDGPQPLAAALRRVDPHYNPTTDPDARTVAPLNPLASMTLVDIISVLVMVGSGVVLLLPKTGVA